MASPQSLLHHTHSCDFCLSKPASGLRTGPCSGRRGPCLGPSEELSTGPKGPLGLQGATRPPPLAPEKSWKWGASAPCPQPQAPEQPQACHEALWAAGGSRGPVLVDAGARPWASPSDRVEGDIPHLCRTRIPEKSAWKLLSLWPSPRLLTLASRLDNDLLTAVAPAGRGHGRHPQQILLAPVQVGDPVEELLRTGLVLAGSLWGGGKCVLENPDPRASSPQPQPRRGALGSEAAASGLCKGRHILPSWPWTWPWS